MRPTRCPIKYKPNYNLLQDPDWLYDKYIRNNMLTSKIAILCNCSSPTVVKYLKIYNIFLPSNKKEGLMLSKIDNENWLYIAYVVNNKTLRQISLECNCSIDTVRSRLIEFNISRRDTKFKVGRIQTKEQIDHNRKTHLGRHLSIETKNCISRKAKGRKIKGHPWTENYKQKHSGPNHWNWTKSFINYAKRVCYTVRSLAKFTKEVKTNSGDVVIMDYLLSILGIISFILCPIMFYIAYDLNKLKNSIFAFYMIPTTISFGLVAFGLGLLIFYGE